MKYEENPATQVSTVAAKFLIIHVCQLFYSPLGYPFNSGNQMITSGEKVWLIR